MGKCKFEEAIKEMKTFIQERKHKTRESYGGFSSYLKIIIVKIGKIGGNGFVRTMKLNIK